MVQPRAHVFATFIGGSPLLLAQRHDIPITALKSILEFIGETSISPLEHFKKLRMFAIFMVLQKMMLQLGF